MNNNIDKQAELGDVLDALQLSGETLTPEILTVWIRRYPQFEKEIMNFAAFDAVVTQETSGAEDIVIPQGSSSRNLAHVREIVANAYAESRTIKEVSPKIASLTAAGELQNLRFPQIAQKIGLSIPLLANLEQRFVKFASVPEELISKLADVLKVSAQSVAAYLQLPPVMTTEANFKSQNQPEAPANQADFFELIAADPMLSIEQKRELLKMKK